MADFQPGNGLNKTTANPSKPHSTFNLSYYNGLTPRFGVNTPIAALEVVPADGEAGRFSISPSCQTRSYTLKAPMFGDIKKHVAFYQVPLQSILPNNWEKIVKNASHGTDVQGESDSSTLVSALDGVNCVVSNFASRIVNSFLEDYSTFKTRISQYQGAGPNGYSSVISDTLKFVARWEMFFSHGSLLSQLGVHYGHLLKFEKVPQGSTYPTLTYTFDGLCQGLLNALSPFRFSIVDDDGTASISGSGASHIRAALDFIRSHSGPCVCTFETLDSSPIAFSVSDIRCRAMFSDVDSEPLNYGRCVAYQIVNAHFYTNDRIDYINTADLYRQYIGSICSLYEGPLPFIYNGVSCFYDWLSGIFMNSFLSAGLSYANDSFWSEIFPYFNAIFGHNYSLRFLDYFTGARPRNLAISGPNTPTNVQVENNSVDVINITRSLVAQRFLNAVARVPSNIEDYGEKILGRKPSYDWHNPKYLFSYDENLFTSEIENTGAAQQSNPNSVTSVLRGQSRNLQFDIQIDRHSWIIGIETYDFRRFYFTTQARNTMAIDRFDMFVPELQYIGDQELRLSELIAGAPKEQPFGYTLRDMQFKQLFDECSGGFVENLPGWLFSFDPSKFSSREASELAISPEYIRSKPTELDRFYLSLTGLTLASYFHFIELWHFDIKASRPMIAAPQIL